MLDVLQDPLEETQDKFRIVGDELLVIQMYGHGFADQRERLVLYQWAQTNGGWQNSIGHKTHFYFSKRF